MYNFELKDPHFLPHCACDLKLSLRKGEALVILGENGIGKSTLLRRLYAQEDMNSRSVIEQKASEYFFDRELSALKNIFLKSEIDLFQVDRFESLWKRFNLRHKENRHLSELSGGETQALKICLALAKKAPLYFLDEPSQYLDQVRKKVLAEELERLRESGHALLLIEHEQDWLPQGWRAQELVVENSTLQEGRAWTI
jgi:ABC-type Mn2+/Zn2+ transport system ATPase subunit